MESNFRRLRAGAIQLIALGLVGSLFLLESTAKDYPLNLGNMVCAKAGGAAPVRMSGIRSSAFRMKVGGVGFSLVANPLDPNTAVEDLRYDPSKPDGKRLEAHFKDSDGQSRWLTVPGFDWEFLPCVVFAATEDESCFTIFGELEDKTKEAELIDSGHRILNYHPAFEDTLMGLRLFQADILLLSAESADLPRGSDGYVLGAGENPPDLGLNQEAQLALRNWLDELETSFNSYVITENPKDGVSFDGGEFTLSLVGRPYWECWAFSPAYTSAKELIQGTVIMDGYVKFLISRMTEGEVLDPEADETQEAYMTHLESVDLEAEIQKRVLEEVPGEQHTITLGTLSRELSEKIESENDGINPEVYRAVRAALEFSALFRYVKGRDEVVYARFAQSVASVPILPEVATPDHVQIPEEQMSSEIQQFLDRLNGGEPLE